MGRSCKHRSRCRPSRCLAKPWAPIVQAISAAPLEDSCGSGGRCRLPPVADECPNHVLVGLLSYDSFRGIQDGNWQNNGIVAGFNFGSRLGVLSDLTGIGFQIGATVGAFDWSGSDYRLFNQDSAETQGFFTFGLFRRALDSSPWTAAIVQDTMYNNNFGVFGQNPMLVQMRGWIGYCTNAWNEFGIWGTWRGWGDTINVPGVGPTTWQPVQQLNVFWHHKWQTRGPDTWFWVGRPEQSRLTRDGSLGDYLAARQPPRPCRIGSPFLRWPRICTPRRRRARPGRKRKRGISQSGWRFIRAPTPARPPWPAAAGRPLCRWPTTATSWWIRIARFSAL